MIRRWFRGGCMLLGILVIVFGLIPLLGYGIFHTGVLLLLVFGVLLCCTVWFWDRIKDHPYRIHRRIYEVSQHPPAPAVAVWWRITRAVLTVGLSTGLAAGAVLTGEMVSAAHAAPPPDATVVVLGCQVVDGKPSLMLRRRLDAAYGYLAAYPDTPVIVAGGLDARETLTEAAVMQTYLTGKGIAPERIFIEDQSKNTAENLAFTSAIITAQGLSKEIAIASDGFHQLRAAVYARKNGLTPAAITSSTPWGLVPSYWVREFPALAKAVFLHLNDN